MIIRWHGHSCFEIDDEHDTIIVTDPHDGKSIGIKPPFVTADMALISHDHFDHANVKAVGSKDTRVIDKLGKSKFRKVRVKGFDSYHDQEDGKRRGSNIIFRFKVTNIVLCHLGDLGHPLDEKTIKDLGPIDILFIPVGGVFTLDAQEAWKLARAIAPKVVIPMHYRIGGLSIPVDPVDKFRELAEGHQIIKVGSEIDFFQNDLPTSLTLWEFSL